MKKGQKLIKIELGFSRSNNSSQKWILYGEVLKKSRGYGKVVEAINFSKPPFKETGRTDGLFDFYYTGVVLVKIIYPSGDYDYGVGLFWVDPVIDGLWYQKGYVCLLSDVKGKRYLKKTTDYIIREVMILDE